MFVGAQGMCVKTTPAVSVSSTCPTKLRVLTDHNALFQTQTSKTEKYHGDRRISFTGKPHQVDRLYLL